MDKYKVKVNPRAIRELDHIYEYIANENLLLKMPKDRLTVSRTKSIKQAPNDIINHLVLVLT